MLTLKAFLDRGFQRSFIVMNAVSFVLLSIIIFTISYYNSKDQLAKNLASSSRTATDFLYSQDISKIADHFNAMGSSSIYDSVTLLDKRDKYKIFESQFSKISFVPSTCSTNEDSDLIILKACTPIITSFNLLIILLSVLSYLTSVFLIYRFVRKKTLLAFQSIADSLIDPENNLQKDQLQILELQDIKFKLVQRSNQIVELSKAAALATLSKQVAHDIRSPLYALKNILRGSTSNLRDEEAVFKSLDRLNNIAQNLLDATHNPRSLNLPNYRRFQLLKIFSDLAEAKASEYPSRKLDIAIECDGSLFLWFNETTFERIISNCWNNSIEAILSDEVHLKVVASVKGKLTSIKILDNGPGFPNNFFSNLASNKIESSKDFGHGIGLQHAIESLRNDGCLIDFRNTGGGAEVDITFNENNYASKLHPIILIDDDKYIRYSWSINAEKIGIPFFAFPSFSSFRDKSTDFDKYSEIFIDSDLGDGQKGEAFLAELTSRNFRRLNLQTGSDASEFPDFTHLNSIVSKSFPY